jgi:integrase
MDMPIQDHYIDYSITYGTRIMPAKRITDAFVRNVRPPNPGKGSARQVAYIDTIERGLALVLVVSYGGSKTFRVLTYRNGKPRSQKLGTYPQMTVKAAREKAREYFQNPERFAARAEIGSLKNVAENWFRRHVEGDLLRSHAEIRRQLEKYVYPRWKDRKFLEIRRRDVNELLDYVADNHGRNQADAVLATIRHIMNWHQSRDENYVSPIVKGMRRNKPVARERILNDTEIRRLWRACDQVNATFGALIKIALLTAQRRDKVATMRWDDFADGAWTIRVEDREKGTAGKLKLPEMALEIIEQQPRIAANPYVFPGRGTTALNSFSQRKAELDEKLSDMEPWVIHDLRRTARSLLSRAGVRPDISERVMGHAIGGVEGVYDRHTYDVEKADALNRLATLLGSILNPPSDKVVQLQPKKGVALEWASLSAMRSTD